MQETNTSRGSLEFLTFKRHIGLAGSPAATCPDRVLGERGGYLGLKVLVAGHTDFSSEYQEPPVKRRLFFL